MTTIASGDRVHASKLSISPSNVQEVLGLDAGTFVPLLGLDPDLNSSMF